MENNKKQTKEVILNKIIFLIIFIAIALILIMKLFPFMINLSSKEGQFEFKEMINEMGLMRSINAIRIANSANTTNYFTRRTIRNVSRNVLWYIGRSISNI